MAISRLLRNLLNNDDRESVDPHHAGAGFFYQSPNMPTTMAPGWYAGGMSVPGVGPAMAPKRDDTSELMKLLGGLRPGVNS